MGIVPCSQVSCASRRLVLHLLLRQQQSRILAGQQVIEAWGGDAVLPRQPTVQAARSQVRQPPRRAAAAEHDPTPRVPQCRRNRFRHPARLVQHL